MFWQARMTPPRPVLSAGDIAAGRERRAAGRSSLGELGPRATPTPCLLGASLIQRWLQKSLPPVCTGDKPQSVAKQLPWGKSSSPYPRASASVMSSLALQRLRGEPYLVLQQMACGPCSSSTTGAFNSLPTVPSVANQSGTMKTPLIQPTRSVPYI